MPPAPGACGGAPGDKLAAGQRSLPPTRRSPDELVKKRPTPAPTPPRSLHLAEVLVWAMVLLTPLIVWPTAKDAFRLPKLMAGEWLGLASLVFLAWRLRSVGRIGWRQVAGQPLIQAVAPLLVVATLTLATSEHPFHVRQGLADLWIGAACLVGWGLALPPLRLRRLLDGLLPPAVLLAAVAAVQFHDLWEPLQFFGAEQERRLGITSLAGNPGDLGAYLILPALVAQQALWAGRRRRWLWALGLGAVLYGILVTQSLTAVAALLAASAVLWGLLLPRRRALAVLGGSAVLGAVLVLAVAPLRERVLDKARDLSRGEVNQLLTGRLDGWWAAVWMVGERPLAGVGQGAYRAEFIPAKLALAEQGVEFYRGQQHPVFANAHNEYLEVAAEWGWPGVVVLAWALFVLARESRRIGGREPPERRAVSAGDRALAWAGLTALAVLALTFFPFRVALVAFPALLFLAWSFRVAAGERREAEG